MFKDTPDGQTYFCDACEFEARFKTTPADHTCGMPFQDSFIERKLEEFNKEFTPVNKDGVVTGQRYIKILSGQKDFIRQALEEQKQVFLSCFPGYTSSDGYIYYIGNEFTDKFIKNLKDNGII